MPGQWPGRMNCLDRQWRPSLVLQGVASRRRRPVGACASQPGKTL